MINRLYRAWKKIAILLCVGFVMSFFLKARLNLSGVAFLSDMFFTVSMVFFLYVLWEVVNNMGIFNSLKFGTKSFVRLIKSKLGPSEQVKQEYVDYVSSRPRRGDIAELLLCGGVLLALSVLISFINI